ncbi:unnamed protein product [Prorocentrum cordatum]|uniref:Potassium channel domain-containing protein n=1 Tax=Prorocentrum cordatum TaxID=2364126 RepID=A0ABN9XP62_9DINO|nr:unnamed protein product [Polarella glacialis]
MSADVSCRQVPSAPGVCPAEEVIIPWADWFPAFLLWPAVVQAALVAVFWALSKNFRWAVRRCRPFRRFLKTWVGTPDYAAKRYRWLIGALVIEMMASSMSVSVWFSTVYKRQTSVEERNLLVVASLVSLVNWVTGSLQNECSVESLLRAGNIVNTFTIVPMLSGYFKQDAGGHEWASLQFLRAYNVVHAFRRIQRLSLELQQKKMFFMVTVVVLRVVALVVILAGVIFTVEILGDPPGLRDAFVASQGGDSISAFQMFYWTVVTLTTVGFGDFAPRTTLSRFLTVFFIITGVVYIAVAQFKFQEALLEIVEGSGLYHGKHGQKHVVVILCSKKRAMSFRSLVAGFLREILHSNSQAEWPNVVIFSRHPWDDDTGKAKRKGQKGQVATFAEFLVEEGFAIAMRERVTFIVGSTSSQEDLDRAGVGLSEMTFLLSDVNSTSPSQDDEDSIYSAVTIKDFYPSVRLRMMLLKPQSKELAVQSGIEIVRCFSLRELKAGMLAQNVRCHGIVPVLTSMLKSVDDDKVPSRHKKANAEGRRTTCVPPHAPLEHNHSDMQDASSHRAFTPFSDRPSAQTGDGDEPEWLKEYKSGVQRSLYGFELDKEYAGCSFAELASRIFQDTGAVVIACFINSKLVVCKQDGDIVQPGTIMFAVASSPKALDPCRKAGATRDHWRQSLFSTREANLRSLYKEGPRVAAAQFMGHDLRGPVLMPEAMLDLDDDRVVKRQSLESSAGTIDCGSEEGSDEGDSPLSPPSPPSPTRLRRRASLQSMPEEPQDRRTPMRSSAHQRQAAAPLASLPATTPPSAPASPWRARDRRVTEAGAFLHGEPRPSPPHNRQPSAALATEADSPSERAARATEEVDHRETAACCFEPARRGGAAAPAALRAGGPGPQDSGRRGRVPAEAAYRFSSETSEVGQPVLGLASDRSDEVLAHGQRQVLTSVEGSNERGELLHVAQGQRGMRGSVQSMISAGGADLYPQSRPRPSTLVIDEQEGGVSRRFSMEGGMRQSARHSVSSARHSVMSLGYDAHARDPASDVRQRVLEMRRAVREAGEAPDLVVVVVCHGEAWQQVHTFVSALRATYQPVHSPIIILTPMPPPPLLFEDAASLDLAILEGSCTKVQALLEAGILEASAVVVMTGATEEWHVGENLYRDSKVVLCAQVLECWCGVSEREVFTTYELQDSTSVRVLPKLMPKVAVDFDRLVLPSSTFSDGHLSPMKGSTDSVLAMQAMAEQEMVAYSERPPEVDHEDSSFQDYGTSAIFHPRFAAGQIFTPELWGAMLGRIYYMPAIIELIEALALPHVRGQVAFPWQIRVPPSYVDKEYSTLFLDLAMGYRPGAKDIDPPPQRESVESLLDSSAVGDVYRKRRTTLMNGVRLSNKPRPAVCVALYRRRDVDASWDVAPKNRVIRDSFEPSAAVAQADA